VWGVVAHR